MKYIAIFDIPDGYVMGCACGEMYPDDGKVRCDTDFENVYAVIEPMTDEQEEMFRTYGCGNRIIDDLEISNAYNMPAFWYNGKDYNVIPTKIP